MPRDWKPVHAGLFFAVAAAGVMAMVSAFVPAMRLGSTQDQEAADHHHMMDMDAMDHGAGPSLMEQTVASIATPVSAAGGTIWGVVDATTLGTCSAAIHDRYVVDGGDGYLYRTWHPRTVTVNGTTCSFGHEHGDDPASQANAQISTQPVRFGYIGRRYRTSAEPNGHEEPHEGFKVFVANRGARNDGRSYLHDSRLVFHMGTGGPKRFNMRMHSMEYRVLTNDGRKMFVQGMGDTGGVGNICASQRQGKTVIMLSSCKLDSSYEIWEEKLTIRAANGQQVAQAVTSSAVFDPITVYDPNNTTRVLFVWDDVMEAVFRWWNDRTTYRGCKRESYHGPTYWYNQYGRDTYYTDATGREVVYSSLALQQEISRHGYKDFVATSYGDAQFKIGRSYCSSSLGLKN